MQTLFSGSIKQLLICILLSSISIAPLFSQSNDESYTLKTVVIDPGHGGKAPGTVGKLAYEKDVVLKIGLLLGELIEKNHSDVNVIYTRKDDSSVALDERANIANKHKADLFISIHANSVEGRPTVFGTETWTMGVNKNQRNLEVVKKENSVITLEDNYKTKYMGFDPNSPESQIMFDLMSDNSQDNSISFASFVEDNFKSQANRHSRGIKQGPFIVLVLSSMPRVLIEVGYMSNTSEEKYLLSENGQNELANSIFDAFTKYKKQIEDKSHISIRKKNPTPDNKVSEVIEVPTVYKTSADSAYYKIQVLTSSTDPLNSKNKLIEEEFFESFKSGRFFKYTIKKETSLSKINSELIDVKKTYKDAFIIGVKDGKIIPANKLKTKQSTSQL